MEHILKRFPLAEIPIFEIFKPYHKLWLSPYFSHQHDKQTFNFAFLNGVEQLVQHPILIPDSSGDTFNFLDLFLTFNPSARPVKRFSPFGSSDHNLMSVPYLIAPVLSFEPL